MMNIAMFITAQMAALYLCWRLAIVGIPALLMLIIPGLVYGKLLSDVGEKIQEAYGVAGGIAEQALSSVRTVYSYVREEKTAESYSAALKPTLKLGFKQGLLKGMAIGSVGIGYGVWALQGWYGSILVTEKNLKGGNIFTAGVCIIYGGLFSVRENVNDDPYTWFALSVANCLGDFKRLCSVVAVDEIGGSRSSRGE